MKLIENRKSLIYPFAEFIIEELTSKSPEKTKRDEIEDKPRLRSPVNR